MARDLADWIPCGHSSTDAGFPTRAAVPSKECFALFLLCVFVGVSDQPAYAYRPFDSTDAVVAARGEVEIEFGPLGYLVDENGRFLVVPATIVNFGVAERWELVIEGREFIRLNPAGDARRASLGDTALSVKGVLREGSLQGRTGPSVATEVGILLPTVGAEPGTGASFAAIASQQWSAVTIHVNGAIRVSRSHALGGFGGAIVEGPHHWAVRPVAEVLVEHDSERTVAGLVGAIWQVRENLSMDAGWRVARGQTARGTELRAGLTWAFPL